MRVHTQTHTHARETPGTSFFRGATGSSLLVTHARAELVVKLPAAIGSPRAVRSGRVRGSWLFSRDRFATSQRFWALTLRSQPCGRQIPQTDLWNGAFVFSVRNRRFGGAGTQVREGSAGRPGGRLVLEKVFLPAGDATVCLRVYLWSCWWKSRGNYFAPVNFKIRTTMMKASEQDFGTRNVQSEWIKY